MEEERALEVCESVLDSCSSLHTTIFMLHYILERLHHCTKNGDLYANKLLGAKVQDHHDIMWYCGVHVVLLLCVYVCALVCVFVC